MFKSALNSPIFNTWFSNLVILVSSLIAIPIVITKLSVEEVNVWFLLFTITSLGQGVLFGFNGTFVRFIAYSYAGVSIAEFRTIKNKKQRSFSQNITLTEFNQIFNLMRLVYLFLSVVFLIVLILVGYFGLTKPINALSVPSDGWYAWYMVLFSATVTLSLGYFRVFLEGIGKVALVQRILGIVNLVGLCFILCVLILWPSLVSIVAVYQAVILTSSIAIFILAVSHLKSLSVTRSVKSFDFDLFKLVWESAWKSGVTTVIASSVKHISAILVAQWFSPVQSASYQFTKRLFDVIENFTMTTFQARIPQIAKYRSRGDMIALIPFLKQTHSIAYIVFLVGYFVLLFGGSDVLTIIGSKVDLASIELIMLFSLATFLSRWGGMSLSVSSQSNHVVEHISASIVAVVFFPVVFFFYDSMGVIVFPFAHILAMLATVPVIARQVYPTIQTGFFRYEKTVMFPALIVLVLVNFSFYWMYQ